MEGVWLQSQARRSQAHASADCAVSFAAGLADLVFAFFGDGDRRRDPRIRIQSVVSPIRQEIACGRPCNSANDGQESVLRTTAGLSPCDVLSLPLYRLEREAQERRMVEAPIAGGLSAADVAGGAERCLRARTQPSVSLCERPWH